MRELNASLLTGSITLPYCEPSPPITTAAVDQKLFETGRLERRSKSKQASGLRERSGLAGGVAAALSGLGVLQVGQGNVLGSAVENLWHAFGAQRIFGRPDTAAVFAALGICQVLRGRSSVPPRLFFLLRADPAPHCCHGTGKGAQLGFRSSPNHESRQQRQRF